MVVITCGQVSFQQSGVTLYEDSNVLDNGTIKISESSFSWDGNTHKFSIPYNQITLHAIARAAATTEPNGDGQAVYGFPHSHLLVMIDGDRPWDPLAHSGSPASGKNGHEQAAMQVDDEDVNGNNNDEDDDDGVGDGDDRASDCPGTTSLLRFVPSDPSTLEEMYKVLSDCQALNPDEELSGSDLEDLIEQGNENGDDVDDEVIEQHGTDVHDNNDPFNDPDRFMDE